LKKKKKKRKKEKKEKMEGRDKCHQLPLIQQKKKQKSPGPQTKITA
jgi:hypothetical protein